MQPDLDEIERVVGQFGRVLFRHDLHFDRPFREIALFYALVEIALMALAVLANDRLGFRIVTVLDALLRSTMKLDLVALVLRVDVAKGMAAETVHVTVGGGMPRSPMTMVTSRFQRRQRAVR